MSMKYFIYARKSSEAEDRQVASIDSQMAELEKIAEERGLNIVEVFTEAKSAKAPGRPVFNQMIERIKQGEANAILCWKLDRLARNFVDGGQIIEMLQTGVIEHVQTHGRGYYPQDNVLMMSVEFGVANQFIKDLRENTKRGLKRKAESGWLPGKAPLGYVNEKYAEQGKKRILPDEGNFELLRKCWDLLLDKELTVESLYDIAVDELGLVKAQGKPPKRSNFYNVFRNPFYYGEFAYNEVSYWGKHKPMVTKEEFDLAQMILDRKSRPQTTKHQFKYTRLMECGECSASITAEEKIKKQKNGNVHHYVYYRCTKRKGKCSQKPIKVEKLEEQMQEVLSSITLPKVFVEWALECIKEDNAKESDEREKIIGAQQRQYNAVVSKIDNLIDMRAGGELTQDEFATKKQELLEEKQRLSQLIEDTDSQIDKWIEATEEAFNFATTVAKNFPKYSAEAKRTALRTVGSNLVFEDRKLRIQKRKIYKSITEIAEEVNAIEARLEPLLEAKNPINKERLYKAYSESDKMGG